MSSNVCLFRNPFPLQRMLGQRSGERTVTFSRNTTLIPFYIGDTAITITKGGMSKRIGCGHIKVPSKHLFGDTE